MRTPHPSSGALLRRARGRRHRDPAGADEQTFEQDCTVCCRPWRVHVSRDEDGEKTLWLEREDE